MKKIFTVLVILFISTTVSARKFNAYNLDFKTSSTEHFRVTYANNCEHLVDKIGTKLEQLYIIFKDTYGLVLPAKTEVVILDGDYSNGWALPYTNTITFWTHDFDYNLRGTHDWWEDVITHEFAHIVSIWTGLKMSNAVPDIRFGYFSHPNQKSRVESFYSIGANILPVWFTEGIAQYESSRHGGDSWDSHRDMFLRSLVLSDKMLTWDHMQVFAGRGNDYEKSYNHGFALVKYIAEKYGYEKVVLMARQAAKINRFDFDRVIKDVLGISGRRLYGEWKSSLEKKYKQQITGISTQVYGKKINKDGYNNSLPKFAPNGKDILFLSNGKSDGGLQFIFKYTTADTVDIKKRITPYIMNVNDFYDIHPQSGYICYSSAKSKESQMPSKFGGERLLDVFIDTLPPEKKVFRPFHKTDRQITKQKSINSSAFSPTGDRIVCSQRRVDKFYLVITDTSKITDKTRKRHEIVFPAPGNKDIEIDYIYSVDWAPDGRHIAFSYMDKKDRKIAIFDTTSRTCEVLCDTKRDERDPTYSPDSKRIYFSSDRTGIFNVYCYHFETGSLEQITNVSGGAFAPSISPDGLKMVYAGFDKNGYSIYLLDSIKALSSLKIDTAFTSVIKSEHIAVSNSGTAEPAARFPSQFLIMPAFITEQVNTARNDVNRGSSTMKAGIIVNVIEPLTLSDMGSELGGYLFIEPSRILNFDKKSFIFGPKATYDVGLFGATQRLPVGLSADYGLRGIADNDEFYNETEDSVETLPYQARIQNLNFQLSHYLVGNPNSLSSFGFSVNLIGGFNRYDISLLLMDQTVEFTYNLNKGFHAGAMAAFNTVKREMKSSISPCGIVAKLQYDFNQQHSLKEDNSFSGNTQREQYDDYRFHQVRGHTKFGIPAPWAKKTDIHFDLQGAAIKVIQQDKQFPSFLKPIAWIPGYSYYYRDIKIKDINGKDTTRIQYDTVQITGNAVMSGEISYRFPLSPRLIDKKLWIFYLERLYGAINVSGGAGFDDPKDFLDFEKEDWIMSYGLEARLEAQTFSSMPLAIKFRWDNGIDRKAPLGGHRFSLSIGYEFDNWGYILSPDYRNKMVL